MNLGKKALSTEDLMSSHSINYFRGKPKNSKDKLPRGLFFKDLDSTIEWQRLNLAIFACPEIQPVLYEVCCGVIRKIRLKYGTAISIYKNDISYALNFSQFHFSVYWSKLLSSELRICYTSGDHKVPLNAPVFFELSDPELFVKIINLVQL